MSVESWYFEENELAIWCYVRKEANGRRTAWATLELLSDFTQLKSLLKGVRYKSVKDFATRDKAAAACSEMALKWARSGEVMIG